MKSRGLGFSQVVSTFWIFYFFYLKKVIKVQKSTKSKSGVFLMLRDLIPVRRLIVRPVAFPFLTTRRHSSPSWSSICGWRSSPSWMTSRSCKRPSSGYLKDVQASLWGHILSLRSLDEYLFPGYNSQA